MKKVLFIVALVCISVTGLLAQSSKKIDEEVAAEAKNIKKELSLSDHEEHLVYNVLNHVKKRIEDLHPGHENYAKYISYINDEQEGMLKSALPTAKYKKYESVFGKTQKQKIEKLIADNKEFIKKNGAYAEKSNAAATASAATDDFQEAVNTEDNVKGEKQVQK